MERAERPSARVIVVDDDGYVLLFLVADPGDTKPPVWLTPGGGVKSGESLAEAAARELAEETGLRIDPGRLGLPLAVCRGEWEFRGTPLSSVDWFFGLRATRFELSTGGWEPLERELHVSWQWWSTEQLRNTRDAVLPAGLAGLVERVARGELASPPVELPWTTI